MAVKTCTIRGCEKVQCAKGWCRGHYDQWRRTAPLAELGVKAKNGAPDQFLREVAIPFLGDGCLTWPFGSADGRGRISVDGKTQLAHRVVCRAVHGEPPATAHQAAHSCGNGHLGCVNPRHLRWASHAENMKDMIEHGTSTRGERHGSSKLSEEDVRGIRARLAKGQTQTSIAAEYGVDASNICHIKLRKSWSWLTSETTLEAA